MSMEDPTEPYRRGRVAELNGQVQSNDEKGERERLEALYGRVWNTEELSREFEVIGFAAPLVVVRRKLDGRKGSLEFQHRPRLYFNWMEHSE
jgi:hypothetical protein